MAQNVIISSSEELQELIENAVEKALTSALTKQNKPFAELPDFVTKSDAAKMCSVSIATINNWVNDGRLKQSSKNGRVVRFDKSEIITLMSYNPKYKRV